MGDNNKLTVYKNEMNTVPFKRFNSIEMDLFFSICTEMRDKGLQKIRYSFDELKAISRYKDKHRKRFIDDLDKTYSKMLELSIRDGDDMNFKRFVLFTGFEVNNNEEWVEVKTNPDFQNIINQISNEFTKFELQEFTNLKSSYSKTAFRLLKQFRQTGFWKIKVTEFRELLDVPASYPMNRMTQVVLNPIQAELSEYFEGLEIRKIKAKKSNRIEFFEFHFFREDDVSVDGKKTFRDDDGFYYEKDLEQFTEEEEKKAFPDPVKVPEKEKKSFFASLFGNKE